MTTPVDITTRVATTKRAPGAPERCLSSVAVVLPFPARPNPDPDPLAA